MPKPSFQNAYSQAVVWVPAPRSPVGENNPGKLSACATTMVAVKKYPLASTSNARERRIAYWANNSTAVIKSMMTNQDL